MASGMWSGVLASSCEIVSSGLFVFVVVVVAGVRWIGVVVLLPGGVGRWGVVGGWRGRVRLENLFLLARRSNAMCCSRSWRGDVAVVVRVREFFVIVVAVVVPVSVVVVVVGLRVRWLVNRASPNNCVMLGITTGRLLVTGELVTGE